MDYPFCIQPAGEDRRQKGTGRVRSFAVFWFSCTMDVAVRPGDIRCRPIPEESRQTKADAGGYEGTCMRVRQLNSEGLSQST
jgi:hypothetical protein